MPLAVLVSERSTRHLRKPQRGDHRIRRSHHLTTHSQARDVLRFKLTIDATCRRLQIDLDRLVRTLRQVQNIVGLHAVRDLIHRSRQVVEVAQLPARQHPTTTRRDQHVRIVFL